MLNQERYSEIMKYIKKNKSVTVNYMSGLLKVSVDTVRRDLKHLEKEGLLVRTHGGAVLHDVVTDCGTITERKGSMTVNKTDLGKEIAPLIRDGEVLFLDGSSTTLLMIPELKRHKNLTIVTNSVYTAVEVMNHEIKANLHILGGKLHYENGSIVGNYGIDELKNFHISSAVLSCYGLTIEEGYCDIDFDEAVFKRAVIEQSQHVYFLMDHSKIGLRSPVKITEIRDDITLITEKVEDSFVKAYQSLAIGELIVKKEYAK